MWHSTSRAPDIVVKEDEIKNAFRQKLKNIH